MTDTTAPFDPEAFRASLTASLNRIAREARAQIEVGITALGTIGRAFQLRDERDEARDEAGRLTGELARAEMEIERLRGHATDASGPEGAEP